MCKTFSITAVLVLISSAFVGCNATDKEEATKSSLQPNAANTEAKSDEKQHQYRSVCMDKEAHGGNEYVLSRWLDSRDKANELGQYHGDFKYKGHRWRIDERAKAERSNR
jgi:hypothetical protein